MAKRNSHALFVAVTALVASLSALGCDGEETVTVPNNGGNAGSGAVAGTGSGATAGSGGSAGSGGQVGGHGGTAGSGGDVGGTGGATGGSGGVAGSGGVPTGGAGGEAGQGGPANGGGGTGGQGGSVGGAGGLGGNPGTGGVGGPANGGGGSGGSPSGGSGGIGGVPATGGAGGMGGQGGSGGSGGQQCPAWTPGPGLMCSGWTQLDDPDLAAMNLVWGGQALSETDVFVVGGTYSAGKIVRYNGSDWVDQNVPNTANLMNVFALSPTEAYAVGKGPKFGYDCIMIELAGGDAWATVTGIPTNGMFWGCRDVWGENSSDLFLIAGDTVTAKIYRGPKIGPWSEMALPAFGSDVLLTKIWGSSTSDVYAVGYLSISGNPTSGVALHFDGNPSNEWVSIPVDPSIIGLDSISGSGPCDVVIGGRANDGNVYTGVTAYYDGNSWSAPAFTAEVQNVAGLAQRAPNETLAAGYTDAPSEGGFGSDDGNHGLLWQKPLGQYGYFRGLTAVPGSDMVFVFAESSGGHVLSTHCF